MIRGLRCVVKVSFIRNSQETSVASQEQGRTIQNHRHAATAKSLTISHKVASGNLYEAFEWRLQSAQNNFVETLFCMVMSKKNVQKNDGRSYCMTSVMVLCHSIISKERCF